MYIANISTKEISAIDLSLIVSFPGGGESYPGALTYGVDLMENIIQGKGGLAPGATYEMEIPQSGPVHGTVDMVIYPDGTADVLNPTVFKLAILRRKAGVLAMQKANELMAKALTDPTDPHPSVTVASQLRAMAHRLEVDPHKNTDDPSSYEAAGFRDAAQNIGNAPRDPSGRSSKEDDQLRKLIKYNEDRITLTLPHTVVGQGVRP